MPAHRPGAEVARLSDEKGENVARLAKAFQASPRPCTGGPQAHAARTIRDGAAFLSPFLTAMMPMKSEIEAIMDPQSRSARNTPAEVPAALRGTREGLMHLFRAANPVERRVAERPRPDASPQRLPSEPATASTDALLVRDEFHFTF